MVVDLSRYTSSLAMTPSILRAAVQGRPDSWLDSKHADDVFSPRETVAHLVIVEREWGWIYRIKRILDPTYKEDGEDILETEYATLHAVDRLLAEFDDVRRQSIQKLQELELTQDDLARSAHDPDFGTETVRHQIAGWVAHDLYHLGEVFKSFSMQLIDEIGPYQQHLNLPHFN